MVSKQSLPKPLKSILELLSALFDTLAYLFSPKSPLRVISIPGTFCLKIYQKNLRVPSRCLIFKVQCVPVFYAATESDYIIFSPLCQELFLNFFQFFSLSTARSLERLLILPQPSRFVNTKFHFFCFYFILWQKRQKLIQKTDSRGGK